MPEWFTRLDGSHLAAVVAIAVTFIVCATWTFVAYIKSDRD